MVGDEMVSEMVGDEMVDGIVVNLMSISLTISSHLASSLHISYGGGGDERKGRDCERGG